MELGEQNLDWGLEHVPDPRSITEQISAFHQFDIAKYPGLSCSEEINFHQPSIDIPNLAEYVDVTRMGDAFYWKIELPEMLEERMSRTTLSTTMSRHEINRLRHEMVAEALQLGNTDATFDSIYPSCDDGMDKLTPDFLVKTIDGVVHCIEIATTRATEERQIKSVADTKIFKYKNALFMRSRESTSSLTVIIVNQHGVYSNVMIDQYLVDDLSIRFKLMIALENVGKEKGFNIFLDREDEELNKIALDIEDQIKQITVNENIADDNLLITKDFIEVCNSATDYEKVKEAFFTSVKETSIPERKFEKEPEDEVSELDKIQLKIHDYMVRYAKDEDSRTTKCKPIVNIPKVIPARTEPTTKVKFISVGRGKGDNELIEIWKSAISKVTPTEEWEEMPKQALVKEALETRKELTKIISETRRKRMVKRGRVELKELKSVIFQRYLAKDGIKAKRSKSESWRKQRRKEQSKTLSLYTDLSDIDDFVKGKELFAPSESNLPEHHEKIIELIQEANDMAKNNSEGLNFVKDISKTKLFEFSCFVSELASELTISLSQFVKSKELILKKLRNYNCYILLSPAGKKNPIGWSLLIPKTKGHSLLKEFIGRPLIETTTCYISTFTTTMPDKLENMWNLPSFIINMFSFLAYFYNIQNPTVANCLAVHGLSEMFNLLIAIRLEDKAETEETITQTRYMYMEVFKTDAVLVKPDPFKMLDKLTSRPRSRLNLFMIKRIIAAFLQMSKEKPVRNKSYDFSSDSEHTDPLPTDNWKNLINYMDLKQVNSATKCLSLFYIGYLKNKNATAQGNTNWQLLEKTITEELKVDWSDPQGYSGNARTDRIPKSHQFNIECIKAGSEFLEKRLLSTYGPDWKSAIGKKVLLALSRENSFKLATLKASSLTKDSEVKMRVNRSNNKPVKRRKMLEAVADNIKDFNINPFMKLKTFIDKRMSGSKKARADLFKKQQHGGLREIYVLDEKTRVLQLFIEVCSRTICHEFEEESLTNPKRKLPIINQHFKKTKKYSQNSGRYCLNTNCSLDKTRWNQGFMIRAITVCLIRMLPSEFHGTIQTIMNMWIGKDIKIPPEVIELLLADLRLNSKAYDRLRKEFYGIQKFDQDNKPITRQPFNPYINTKTGFMQGILHYTSSLLHLSYLELCKRMLHRVIQSTMEGVSALISYACSSDDSAMMVSIFFPKNSHFFSKELILTSDKVEKLLHSLENFCKFFCMRPSVKSTVAMLDSVEFNSEFIFNNTLAIPVLKFVIAAVNSTPHESMMDRLNNNYNLLSSLIGAGFPSWNTHVVQLAQAYQSYKELGIGFAPLGDEIAKLILKLKEPNYGFYPLDNERLPGVMGLPYSLYLVYKTTGILPISSKTLKKDPIVSLEGGVPSESLQISHGDRRKQKKLILGLQQVTEGQSMLVIQPHDVDKFNRQLDVVLEKTKVEVNKEYELFYRAAENEKELLVKLKLKALMPGVAKSLCSGSVFIQNTAASLYASHTPCVLMCSERFRRTELSIDNPSGVILEKTSTKVSLLKALKVREREREHMQENPLEVYNMELVCFPLLFRYKEADAIIDSFKDSIEIEVPRFRCQKNKLDIVPHQSRLPLSLLEVLKIIWFGFKNPTSNSILNRCLEIYKQSYPWIRRTHNESLKESPFQTPIELFSFVNSINDGSRSIVLTCPSLTVSGFQGQLSNLIKKNYKQNVVLRRPAENRELCRSISKPKDQLNLSLFITDKDIQQEKITNLLRHSVFFPQEITNILELNRSDLALYLMQKYLQLPKEDFIDLITDILNTTSTIPLLFYTYEQRKIVDESNNTIWVGPGEVLLKIGNDIIVLQLLDSELVGIKASSIMVVNRNLKALTTALTELKVRPSMVRVDLFGVVAKYNGDRVVSKSGVGCPIKIDSNIEVRAVRVKDVSLEVARGKMILKYKMGLHRWVKLIVFHASRENIDTSFHGSLKDDCWEAWVTVSPWKHDRALATVELIKETSESIEKQKQSWRLRSRLEKGKTMFEYESDLKEFKAFLSNTLRARITNVKSTRLFIDECLTSLGEEEEEKEEDELDDDFFNELNMELFGSSDEQYTNLVSVLKEETKLEESCLTTEEDTEDVIDEIISKLTSSADPGLEKLTEILAPGIEGNPLTNILYRKTTTEYTMMMEGLISKPRSIVCIHPLWDDLISSLDKIDSRFISSTMEGIPAVYDPKTSKLLMWLLDIKEKQIGFRGLSYSKSAADETVLKFKRFLESLDTDSEDSD